MNMRLKLAMAIIPLGIIIAAVPENTTRPYKLTAPQLLDEVKEGIQFVSTDEVADMLIQKDPSLQLIDVRDKDSYDKFHLPGAINIPLADLLSVENEDYLNQDVKMNVFYSNGTTSSNEAWMITRQLGYINNYVMQGGLNHYAETIMNPSAPASTSPDDEFARYDFRKGASAALGGGNLNAAAEDAPSAPKPTIKKRAKKKRVAGGC
ncbi:rhodanese-like domain-containing protein [Carboxylicivirga sediminis]|uniref:Rhodanese-like domain-containing protein n=1 Tax=Carboxylicivirga sediminis TaxID=2006564 RepID=A0A941F206_9BACT|nr:rhodanese-like domain-containing protein [Carboxylicivirga sediminis]MBR8535323.1 rhodanese-like domain-containing protein [Carboxylicivirga sediminis]